MRRIGNGAGMLAGAVAALAIAASPGRAQVWNVTLSGAQENPPAATPGTGFATITLSGNSLSLNVTFSGLLGTTTASHIHCCAVPPGNAGVATQVPTFVGFPLGVTSGAYSRTFDLLDVATYNPSFVTANGGTALGARNTLVTGLLAGQAYLNIHTGQFPGGEIRGNIAAVPEPSTYLLMATGLGLVGGISWRRRRSA